MVTGHRYKNPRDSLAEIPVKLGFFSVAYWTFFMTLIIGWS